MQILEWWPQSVCLFDSYLHSGCGYVLTRPISNLVDPRNDLQPRKIVDLIS